MAQRAEANVSTDTQVSPPDCPHSRLVRLGIQRFPFPPYRVYLLRCAACSTTLTTGTLREQRGDGAAPPLSGSP